MTRVALEKRMKNRRFRKTEEKILAVFFDEFRRDTAIIKIAKKAGIGRSTMYEHHRTLRDVLPDYQGYIKTEYSRHLKKILKNNPPLKTIFLELLIFVVKNKRFFILFIESHNIEVLKYMIKCLEPKIVSIAHLPKNHDKIFCIYTGEIIQIIERWGAEGFNEDSLDSVLNDILFLTNTCRSHLTPINY